MKPLLQRTVATVITLLLTSVALWASACDLRCAAARLSPCCPAIATAGMPGMSHSTPHAHAELTTSPSCPTCVIAAPARLPANDPTSLRSSHPGVPFLSTFAQDLPPAWQPSPDRSPPPVTGSRCAVTQAPLRI